MKREGKKVDEGNGGCLRETVVAWSVCCFKLGEGESEDCKGERGGDVQTM